jgi:predicted RNA-binding Zn ribbon-like protein
VSHAFPCGTLALDFVGTLRARNNREPVEMLSSSGLLDAWLVESGMLDNRPGSRNADLVSALKLREAIYSLVGARIDGRPPPAQDVSIVNNSAEGIPVQVHLRRDAVIRSGAAAQGLVTLAREAVEIVGGEDAALLRECGRLECTQVYLDRSRGYRRQWCAMRTCGNRVKASTFRARHASSRELRS